MSRASLGIRKIAALIYYVHDLERVRRFMLDNLDFAEVAVSGPDLTRRGRQRSAVFQAGGVTMVACAPEGEGGRAWRFLRKHPEGIGTVAFDVEDIEHTFRLLEERGGTLITDIERMQERDSEVATFSMTTPFGDTTFRFMQCRGNPAQYPGMAWHPHPLGGQNRNGFQHIDHITANFQTMRPALLWLEHVMGFEAFWSVQFHTQDLAGDKPGSGLKSVVMQDPASGIKFANNEPMRPNFKESQINIFSEEFRGDGIQHAALHVGDILATVSRLRACGVAFTPTPPAYYELLPAHLERIGVRRISEDIETLRQLEILVDGENQNQYMLQIFLKEAARVFDDPEAGPFFFEILQRKGSQSFGAGNFRALFESIEHQQNAARVIS
jgi:4-hydroxyphenylpyruvate dioxygenase